MARYISAVLQATPTPQGLVVVRPDGVRVRLGRETAAVLARFGRLREVELEGPVARLVEAGLLLSESEVRRRLAAAPIRPSRPVSRVVVPTRDRPDQVLEAVRAWRRAGVEVAVYDDAPEDELGALLAGEGVRYAGRADKERWARALGADVGDPEAARDALLGDALPDVRRTGANRNAILLDPPPDGSVLSADDDVRPRGFAGGGAPIASSAPDPTRTRRYASVAEAVAGAVEVDAVALASRWVGAAPRVDRIDEAGPHLLARLAAGEPAAVLSFGLAGDPGWGREGAGLFLEDDADWDAVKHVRAVRRHVAAPTVTDGPHFFSAAFAFDPSADLPPFFPWYRNADGPWGRLVQRTSLVVHAPAALVHLPSPPRAWPHPGLGASLAVFRLSDLLQQWMLGASDWPAEVSARAVDPDLPGSVRAAREALHDRILAALEQVARTPARRSDALLAARCVRERPAEPWPVEVGDEATLRRVLARYAAVLRAWPALREASRARVQAGDALAR